MTANPCLCLICTKPRRQRTFRLFQCKAVSVFVPAGCTSLIQPLDVVYNAPFKKKAEAAATQHMQDNLEAYINGLVKDVF